MAIGADEQRQPDRGRRRWVELGSASARQLFGRAVA
jgi:hypothetical protein